MKHAINTIVLLFFKWNEYYFTQICIHILFQSHILQWIYLTCSNHVGQVIHICCILENNLFFYSNTMIHTIFSNDQLIFHENVEMNCEKYFSCATFDETCDSPDVNKLTIWRQYRSFKVITFCISLLLQSLWSWVGFSVALLLGCLPNVNEIWTFLHSVPWVWYDLLIWHLIVYWKQTCGNAIMMLAGMIFIGFPWILSILSMRC